MGKIKILDAGTAGKIAAGEIVVNPASVVKELLENSLDAGSTRVSVEIVSGGIQEIRVIDNGCGMEAGDLELAFERHATSKISSVEDLRTVRTMGFRGEALASIAAVADITLTTRVPGATEGFSRRSIDGQPSVVCPVGCAEGTSVTVVDLFRHFPARKKFLQQPSTEAYRVHEVVTRVALGCPGTAVKLSNEGRTVFQTPGTGDLLETIAAVFGADLVKGMVRVEAEDAGWHIAGYVSKPFCSRSNRKQQHFFVNGRWVANPSLRYNLEASYQMLLPRGRHPLAVLSIEAPLSAVDVNVDPTKNTVRVENEQGLLGFLRGAVRTAVGQAAGRREGLDQAQEKPLVPAAPDRQMTFKEINAVVETGGTYEVPIGNSAAVSQTGAEVKVIGQLGAAYILCEGPDGLMIVDQHAAHERVLFENLKSRKAEAGRQLLIPRELQFSPAQMLVFHQIETSLHQLGLTTEDFGGNAVVLREVPAALATEDCGSLLMDLVDEFVSEPPSTEFILDRIAAGLACKSAVKAGQVLKMEEMQALMQSLFAADCPLTCPHGRPAVITLSKQTLLKQFARR